MHTHDDQIVLSAPQMLPKISQGVTTVVVGNCGISLAPLVHADVPPPLNLLGGADKYVHPTMAAYVDAVGRARPAVNVAALVGHSTLRVAAMADPYRAATHAEQARMVELLREGMDAGAIGLSSGVFYATGAAADVDELALLAGIAGEAGGVYTTHIRDEREKVLDSLDEAFATGRRGKRAGGDLAPQMRGAAQLGPHRADARAFRRRARAPGDRARRVSLCRRLDRAAPRNGRRRHRHHGHLVDTASGDGGANARGHRDGMGLHAAGRLRSAAAGGRLLFPDGGGGRAAGARSTRRR